MEVKKEDSKAILFTNVVDKKNNKKFDIPVLMNVFCNEKAVKLFIGDGDKIGSEIESLLKMKPPSTFSEKLSTFGKLRITSYNVCYTKLLRFSTWRTLPTRFMMIELN